MSPQPLFWLSDIGNRVVVIMFNEMSSEKLSDLEVLGKENRYH